MAFIPYGALGGGRFRTKEEKEAANSPRAGLPMYHADQKYENVTMTLNEISKEKGAKITQVVSDLALICSREHLLELINHRRWPGHFSALRTSSHLLDAGSSNI